MPQPWSSDLEKLRRDLMQKIERLEAATQAESRSSGVERRLARLEQDLERSRRDSQRDLLEVGGAHGRELDRLGPRVQVVERGLQTTNGTVDAVRTAATRITGLMDGLDRRLTAIERART